MRLKNDVVPHKFDCQPNRKRATSTTVFEDATKRVLPEFVDGTASASTSTLTEYATQASSSGNMFCKTNIETLNLCNKPSTSDNTSTHKTCDIELNLSDKPFVLSKGVQVKPHFQSKYVQCTSGLKNANTSPLKDVLVNSMTSPIRTFKITTPMKECKKNCALVAQGTIPVHEQYSVQM